MAYGAGASEAGAPPADWVVPGIVEEKLGIKLELSMLPSAQGDQDIAISAAGAANDLPDIFMVSREVWMTLVNQGLIASVDDMYSMMPARTKTHYTRIAELLQQLMVNHTVLQIQDQSIKTKVY